MPFRVAFEARTLDELIFSQKLVPFCVAHNDENLQGGPKIKPLTTNLSKNRIKLNRIEACQ